MPARSLGLREANCKLNIGNSGDTQFEYDSALTQGETAFRTSHTPRQPILPPDGNRLRIDHPDGVFFSYLFDGLDRPVFLFENGVIWHMIVPYTPAGPPSAHLLSNGGIRSFGYDGLQRPNAFAHAFAASPGVAWTLAHNSAGQIASIARDNDAYAWTSAYNTARPYAANGLGLR